MTTNKSRIIYLVEKYAAKDHTIDEERELFEILNRLDHDLNLQQELTKIFETIEPVPLPSAMRERILNKVFSEGETFAEDVKPLQPVSRLFTWQRVAAAASIILVLGTAIFLLVNNSSEKELVKQVKPVIQQEILPGSNKAMLTLADNSVIMLEDAQKGTLTQQGNTKITKLEDGRLAYNASGRGGELLYNTIATPRGGQYQMTLSDGTKVWLNAASSLRFPASFKGKERRVELTGEAYFEVAKNASMPFKVIVAGNEEVQVLGTHFNINAYADEEASFTTLLEGAVRVKLLNDSVELVPGQQASIKNQSNTVRRVNVDQVVAWKNGYFNFNDASLQEALRQLSRWYDIEVRYPQGIPDIYFVGEFPRKVVLSDALTFLETTGVHFKMDGNTLSVIP